MKLVIDANVLFSALLKDSVSRLLVTDSRLELISPDFLLDELAKYEAELSKMAKLKHEGFRKLEAMLLDDIRLVPDSDLKPFVLAADTLVSDDKDVLYAACALKENADLWSNNRHLKNNRIKVWTTKELFETLCNE